MRLVKAQPLKLPEAIHNEDHQKNLLGSFNRPESKLPLNEGKIDLRLVDADTDAVQNMRDNLLHAIGAVHHALIDVSGLASQPSPVFRMCAV
jgi:hypothetical protein